LLCFETENQGKRRGCGALLHIPFFQVVSAQKRSFLDGYEIRIKIPHNLDAVWTGVCTETVADAFLIIRDIFITDIQVEQTLSHRSSEYPAKTFLNLAPEHRYISRERAWLTLILAKFICRTEI